MSNTVKAFVEYIYTKDRVSQKSGKPYTTYNAKLQDPETGEVHEKWYQFGFEAPKNAAGRVMEVGDYIQVQVEPNRDALKVIEGSLKIHPNPPPRPNNPNAEQGGSQDTAHVRGKTTPVKDSELFGQIGGYMTEDDVGRITRATALEAAVRTIQFLVDSKAMPMSEAQGAAGVKKRYEQLITAVDKLATKYFFDLATGRQLEAHEDEGTVPTGQTSVVELPTAEPSAEADDFDDEPGDAFPDEVPNDEFE